MGIEKTLIFTKPMPRGTLLALDESNDWLGRFAILLASFNNLTVTGSFTSKLDARILGLIYPDLSSTLWQATLEHLCDVTVYVIIFAGEDAIAKMSKSIGTDSNPNRCQAMSVRRLMTDLVSDHSQHAEIIRNGLQLTDGSKYYYDFAQATRSTEEFDEHFAALNSGRIT